MLRKMNTFKFKHHIIDTTLPKGNYAQALLADVDCDGQLEYIVGAQYGTIYLYKRGQSESWDRHLLGEESPSDVGAAILDVDGDGFPDLVTGGAWYRNPGEIGKTWERITFDPKLTGVHDVVVGDIDGDGSAEVVTMSDRNNLRWYKIPQNASDPWIRHDIGPGVHAGAVLADIDGDGDLDIIRTDVWFENVKGDGTEWVEHFIGFNSSPPPEFDHAFAYYATYAAPCDMNGNGFTDIVFTDAEIPGGKIWWMENLDGTGRSWKRHDIFGGSVRPTRRGAFHSLFVGDMDGNGNQDVFSCAMEGVAGDQPPRYYIWENLDGKGLEWKEHVILDVNLGGHMAAVGDITGNGLPDIITKPWSPSPKNAVDGKYFVLFLENLGAENGIEKS